MKSSNKQLKGVTLVELLVVLMVIAVLAGLTITIINPARQRQRTQDATLNNTISGIAQAIEAVHNIRGSYPGNSVADRDAVRAYMSPGFTVNNVTNANCNAAGAQCGLTFVNPGITVGRVAGGQIAYLIPKTGQNALPCLQGPSNEVTTERIAWAPGYGIRTITQNCNTAAGYAELIAP